MKSGQDAIGEVGAGRDLSPANEQNRHHVEALVEQVQQVTGESVEVAFVDQAYTRADAAQAAQSHGVQLEVVKLLEARNGFVLLPRRWVDERSFGADVTVPSSSSRL